MGVTKKGTDPSRAERKAKKRKLEDAIPDLPGDNENEVVEGEVEEKAERKSKKLKTKDVSAEDKVEKKEKKEKKEKTPKKSDVAEGTSEEKISKKEKKEKGVKEEDVQVKATDDVLADLLAPAQGGEDTAPKKSKKERKAERKAKEAAEKEKAAPAPISTEATAGTAQEGEKKASHEPRKNNNRNRDKRRQEKAAAKDGTEKADRFIVFAGNIPFSATTESITKHFASIKPKSIRHLTQKDDPTKSKGMAFIEFNGFDHMQTCLKLFHHSVFDDGISPPRKINVELTVGGGGSKKERMAKIQDKNVKLADERARRAVAEEKAKFEKKKEGGAADASGIHPSRRARVPGSS